MFLDIWLGIVSITLVQAIVGEVLTLSGSNTDYSPLNIFVAVFATTIVQGLLLNIVLAGYMAIVYGFLSLWNNSRAIEVPPATDVS